MNGFLPIARPRSFLFVLRVVVRGSRVGSYSNLFGGGFWFFLLSDLHHCSKKSFIRSWHEYTISNTIKHANNELIVSYSHSQFRITIISLVSTISKKKGKMRKRRNTYNPPPPLSFIIIPTPIRKKEDIRLEIFKFLNPPLLPPSPTTANFQFLRQRASHIVGGNSCNSVLRWNEDRSKEWSNLRGGFVRWKAANNLMQIRGDLVGEESRARRKKRATG